MDNAVLELKYIGDDFWSLPVYKDQFERLWKDLNLGRSEQPSLYSSTGNSFDGEPLALITQEFVILEEKPSNENKFQYMMLGRLRMDCEYYLGNGNRYANHLHQKNERDQINYMKTLWLSFSEDDKPEWLTWEQILEYEKQMCNVDNEELQEK